MNDKLFRELVVGALLLTCALGYFFGGDIESPPEPKRTPVHLPDVGNGPPPATATPTETPTETSVPPTETSVPPTETSVPPTETSVPPTETPTPPPTSTPGPTPEPAETSEGEPTCFIPDDSTYIIQPGDTLWDISICAYGTPYFWPQLCEANDLSKCDFIHAGNPLVIPPSWVLN